MDYCDTEKLTKYIPTGQVGVGTAPEKLSTILGSCIALLIYNKIDQVGGLAHILYSGEGNDNRFSVTATRCLISEIKKLSRNNPSFVAKVVGGEIGSNLVNPLFQNKEQSILLSVVTMLVEERIDIEGMHTGGNIERNILFDLESGDVIINLGTKDLLKRKILVI